MNNLSDSSDGYVIFNCSPMLLLDLWHFISLPVVVLFFSHTKHSIATRAHEIDQSHFPLYNFFLFTVNLLSKNKCEAAVLRMSYQSFF